MLRRAKAVLPGWWTEAGLLLTILWALSILRTLAVCALLLAVLLRLVVLSLRIATLTLGIVVIIVGARHFERYGQVYKDMMEMSDRKTGTMIRRGCE